MDCFFYPTSLDRQVSLFCLVFALLQHSACTAPRCAAWVEEAPFSPVRSARRSSRVNLPSAWPWRGQGFRASGIQGLGNWGWTAVGGWLLFNHQKNGRFWKRHIKSNTKIVIKCCCHSGMQLGWIFTGIYSNHHGDRTSDIISMMLHIYTYPPIRL